MITSIFDTSTWEAGSYLLPSAYISDYCSNSYPYSLHSFSGEFGSINSRSASLGSVSSDVLTPL